MPAHLIHLAAASGLYCICPKRSRRTVVGKQIFFICRNILFNCVYKYGRAKGSKLA